MLARYSLARLATLLPHPHRMPQLTLGSNLALSTKAPTPSPTKSAGRRPSGSTTSSPFKYGEMAGTLAGDLKKLGVDKSQANTSAKGGTVAGGEDRTAAHGEAADAPKHQPTDEVKTGNIDEGTKREASKGGKRTHPAKAKTTATAPTHEDVEMDDPDHADAAGGAQGEADGAGPGNASAQHQAKKAKGDSSGGVVHEEQDVSGAKGPRGKKRAPSEDEGGVAGERGKETGAKKQKDAYHVRGKVAHPDAAAKVDAHPPLDQLMDAQTKCWGKAGADKDVPKGECVVYWMRMEDLRIVDNRALSLASQHAKKEKLPLVVLFCITPKEYTAHDRSPRRIDFVLRNVAHIQRLLAAKNIPLYIHHHPNNRFKLASSLLTKVLPSLKATHIFGNIEYEVDELRRDIEMVQSGHDGVGGSKVKAVFVHDRLAVPPGKLKSGKGTPYGVYSPWQRAWAVLLEKEPDMLEEVPEPEANDASVKKHAVYGKIFEHKVPEQVEGFECKDRATMMKVWPEGTEKALQVLDKFLNVAARTEDLGLVDPLQQGGVGPAAAASSTNDTIADEYDDGEAETKPKSKSSKTSKAKNGATQASDPHSRIQDYADGRNSADANTSSRTSPYLTSGVMSSRMVLNRAKKLGKRGKLESGRDTGVGMWVQEVAWRDFYNHVMAAFPRVSMGRPFQEKFADVQWETDEDKLQAWKDGRTGFPIVDAAMRQCNSHGWMHNRPRMICASFLCKDLMLDWRLGERYFMQNFIDGDLAANNGGWQWSASTGTDPQPYFRIFNPTSQSEKASPDGAYIRYWVPELAGLKGKAVHDPYTALSPKDFAKLGYPKPIVDHKEARARALFRYKNPGQREE